MTQSFLKNVSLWYNIEFESSSGVVGLLDFEWNANKKLTYRIMNSRLYHMGVRKFMVWCNIKCLMKKQMNIHFPSNYSNPFLKGNYPF